jgi:hypothetical protein
MKKSKFVFLIIAALVLVAMISMAFVPIVQAQEVSPPADEGQVVVADQPETGLLPTWGSAGEFLSWLIGPGLVFAVAWFMSFVTDKFNFWEKVPHDIKVILPFLVAALMVYLGNILLTQFPAIVNDPMLNKIFQALLFYFTTQKQHDKWDQAQLGAKK